MTPDPPAQRYLDAWRARCGLHPLDHPTFARVSRVWRVELHPSFHEDVAITVTDIDAGGWIELRVLHPSARSWALHDAGMGPPLPGDPPAPRVWEATVPADVLEALAAAMPRLPLHSVDQPGRDGMTVQHEALLDGELHAFRSWSPNPRQAPLHYAWVAALCGLAVRSFPDPAAQGALHPLAAYLR